ncbi:glutamate transport system substrate-binding protein [Streptosporangium album]|uniref:Glutamate transport system substrate-binding protein n=1 Tax=Streptosporangium album TaxID=47479 RepID=A0A7W7WC79_9ACTN|nr:glutamate ABC transporter substrate-binding protein [Streptosporangium album]MBB4941040.1 glutamate transport system substrate-binding protein [Streptosporangium album]
MTAFRATLAALVWLALAGCGVSGSPSRHSAFPEGSTMAHVQQRGVLTVGIKFDHPLFGYKDPATGRITGFDAEIARLVARDLTGSESNIRFIETIPRNREDFLRRGVVDVVLATYSITPARRRLVGFTDPYYYAGQDVLVRAGDTAVQDAADMGGKKVCTARGSTSVDRLRSEVPRAEIVLVDTYTECVTALITGRIDAISTDDTILLGLMIQHPEQVRLLRRPFGREPYGMGIRHEDTAFRDYLNTLIAGYLRDGRWDRAFRDTIGVVGAVAEQAKPSPIPR